MRGSVAGWAAARDLCAMPLLVALLVGCLATLILGLYARLHHPTGFALDIVGFSSALYAKAWLTTFRDRVRRMQVVTGRRAGVLDSRAHPFGARLLLLRRFSWPRC